VFGNEQVVHRTGETLKDRNPKSVIRGNSGRSEAEQPVEVV